MKRFALVLLGLTSLASAKPTFPVSLTYATSLIPSAQVGANVRLLESSEVSTVGERTGVANARSAAAARLLRERHPAILESSAPLGADGRVVDTPDVVAARAAHAAAHVNERINLANEIARSSGDTADMSDGGILRTSKVAASRGTKIDLVNEPARSGNHLANGRVVPLIIDNGVVAALVPIGLEGKPLDVPEIAAARGNQNLGSDVRSVDAVAVAGPSLAYGRLIY
ncbi:hypothetical protein PUN28_005255 [Cardiocondyla obscurior]|uniref:Uncharacterized protein n=1 Tax=Cardiocondyla obscurior TaxID=286306 RepID=A0AAW2GEZ7_9HYME